VTCDCDTAIYAVTVVLALFYAPLGVGLVLAYRQNARDWAPFVNKGD
jgi:hypothetical protein